MLENHWQEDKLQSHGEIESTHEFEFGSVKGMEMDQRSKQIFISQMGNTKS